MTSEGYGGSGSRAATGSRHRLVDRLVTVLCGTLTLMAIGWVFEVPRQLGMLLYTEQFLAAALAHTLAAVYLRFPFAWRRPAAAPGAFDWLLAAASFGVGWYVAFGYPRIAENFMYLPTETLLIGGALLVLCLEALRRVTGLSMVLVFFLFFLYALFADLVPGPLRGRPSEPVYLLQMLGLDNSALLGRPLQIAATVVISFVLMGQLLLKSGGSLFFTDLSAALMGRSRGGSAKISIVSSSLFGSISGSAISNVASTGVVTIPLMKRSGYAAHTSAAVEATASTGGQLMPPIMGAAAFLMAEFLQIQYTEVVIAALVPAVLYYVALFIQVDLEAGRNGIRALEPHEIPRLAAVLADGWHFIAPFAVVVGAMFWLHVEPELAAMYATATVAVMTMVFPYRGRRLSLRAIYAGIIDTGKAMADIISICAVAGAIIGLLNLSGLGFSLSFVLNQLGGDSLFGVVLMTAVTCILVGMSMPTISLYVLLAVLVAPSLVALGIEPIAAHMFVLYFGLMSMITPPVALCAFTAASLAEARPMQTGFTAMRLGWTAYIIPFLFVYSPTLLMIGDPVSIVLAIATAVLGVWLASAGIVGYLFRPLAPLLRALFVFSGIALLVPANAFGGAVLLEVSGAVVGALVLGYELLCRRAEPAPGLHEDAPTAPAAGSPEI